MTPERENYFLVIWNGAFEIVGQEVTRQDFQQTKQYAPNPIKWLFEGSFANVWVVAPYGNITRKEALSFATCFMKGRVINYEVNLDRCTVVTTNGIEKTPSH